MMEGLIKINNTMKNFIAIIIIQTESLNKRDSISYEESIISIKASNIEQAKEIVAEYIRNCLTVYKNALGEEKKFP